MPAGQGTKQTKNAQERFRRTNRLHHNHHHRRNDPWDGAPPRPLFARPSPFATLLPADLLSNRFRISAKLLDASLPPPRPAAAPLAPAVTVAAAAAAAAAGGVNAAAAAVTSPLEVAADFVAAAGAGAGTGAGAELPHAWRRGGAPPPWALPPAGEGGGRAVTRPPPLAAPKPPLPPLNPPPPLPPLPPSGDGDDSDGAAAAAAAVNALLPLLLPPQLLPLPVLWILLLLLPPPAMPPKVEPTRATMPVRLPAEGARAGFEDGGGSLPLDDALVGFLQSPSAPMRPPPLSLPRNALSRC